MKQFTILLFLALTSCVFSAPSPAESARTFLLFQYGKDIANITDICLPSKDLWMLQGKSNPQQQKLVQDTKIRVGANGLFMDTIERDICIVEMKDGKVDPAFNLELVYGMHRKLVLQFLYCSLLQENDQLARLVTNIENVSFGGAPKASYGDMDVYSEILSILPVTRCSTPSVDAESKSASYRIPLGDQITTLTIIRSDGLWKIDTSKKITVPLKFFWR